MHSIVLLPDFAVRVWYRSIEQTAGPCPPNAAIALDSEAERHRLYLKPPSDLCPSTGKA